MTLNKFIREHRAELDAVINSQVGAIKDQRRNDEERADWIRNYEPLYLWARREGVKV